MSSYTTNPRSALNPLFAEIKNGTHKQFVLGKEQVECRCGCKAIWWSTGYLCSSITARPCKY